MGSMWSARQLFSKYSETCIRKTALQPSLVSVFKYRCLLNTGLFYSKYWKKRLKHTELFVRLIQGVRLLLSPLNIGYFHSRDQYLCKFTGTKESVYIRKEFNSHRIGLGHQHGRRFNVLGQQYGCRDVMWKHSIGFTVFSFVSGVRVRCDNSFKTREKG